MNKYKEQVVYMKKKTEKKTLKEVQKELDELAKISLSAVVGYEKYLLDELNYKDLARIMTNLRNHLPKGTTGA
tara:strand:+ start:629 stop:847 length:219 start_codon:yes stop_codon:yes gene_type:complete